MKLLEVFCGTKSFSKVAEANIHEVLNDLNSIKQRKKGVRKIKPPCKVTPEGD